MGFSGRPIQSIVNIWRHKFLRSGLLLSPSLAAHFEILCTCFPDFFLTLSRQNSRDQQMVRKEDVDFYCGFSRKELQSLCKRYNLPANRSRTEMAESVASYFEENSLNPVGFGVGGNRAASRTWDVRRDSFRSTEGCLQGAVAREPGSVPGGNTQYQEQNGNGSLIDTACAPPHTRKLNEKGNTEKSKKDVIRRTDSLLENRRKEVDSGDSPSSSSFEFHVSSEEGISLSVDLNYNPSDWIRSMRDEVNVFDSMRRRKSPHTDLGKSNATERKKQKSSGQDKDGHVRRESSNKDNTQLPSGHHSNGERSLASPAIEPCNRSIEGSDACKGTNGHLFSVPDSLVPGQTVPFCVASSSKSSSVHPVELDCGIPPVKKLTSDSVMVAAEQNHPADALLTEIPKNPSMESFHKVGNSSVVLCPGGGGSELSSSEVEAYHSNPLCSSRKTSNISSPELIIDRGLTTYSESFKFQYNGGKNCLQPNTLDQKKSKVLSKQARSE